jgi:two-component system, OmpR family, sensor histidine kinase VanS
VKLRTRIFLGMASLSVGVTALTWGLSFALLEPYYLSLKRKQLVELSRGIGALPSSISEAYAKFAALERSTTVHISVVDKDGSVIYDSNSPADRLRDEGGPIAIVEGGRIPPFAPVMRPGVQPNGKDRPRIGGQLPPSGSRGTQDAFKPRRLFLDEERDAGATVIESGDNWTIFETVDPRLGVKLLFLSRKESSGASLVLSFPIAQAAESARGTMFFLSISCAAAIIISAMLAYLLARSATRPFVELVDLSRSIASLDFSRRFVSRRDDEVSALGGEMNELADNLQRALAELEGSNAKLREDVEREKRVDAMRREFISSVSHELKTPIALILGYAEGIQEGVPNDLAARDAYLAVIVDEAKKMDEQVRDLLELSQIESGVVPLALEDFDLSEIVTETLASFGRTIESRGIEPELSLESVRVRADKRMIARAFVNYFSNAISHIDEHGALAIAIRRVGGEASTEVAELSIYNSGPRIPKKSLDLIWGSYYKVDPARKREFGGTGLGLAIVRGIISRHGGQCSVKNLGAEGERPAGVRFGFTLPLA